MQFLLVLALVFNTIGVVRKEAYQLAPGLSVKNLLLYLAILLLMSKAMLGKRLRFEAPGVLLALAVLVLLAIASTFFVAGSDVYPRYPLMGSLLRIKAEQLDWLCWFVAFSAGIDKRNETERMLKVLLALVGFANVLTIWNAAGLPRIGEGVYNPEAIAGLRRIDGYFGHANETAALIVLYLPIMVAFALSARRAERVMWFGACVASVMVLVGTVSRGGLIALLGSVLLAKMKYSRYLSIGRVVRWAVLLGLLGAILAGVVGSAYLEKFVGRFTSVSTVSASDISSGRTEFWLQALTLMVRHPWSFIVGMGWNTWAVNGFIFLPHSHYLWIYWDLGLAGLVAFCFIFVRIYKQAASVLKTPISQAEARMPLAVIFSIQAWMIAMAFANIGTPWIFVWPLLGLLSRYCYFLLAEPTLEVPAQSAVEKRRDPYSLPRRRSAGVSAAKPRLMGRQE